MRLRSRCSSPRQQVSLILVVGLVQAPIPCEWGGGSRVVRPADQQCDAAAGSTLDAAPANLDTCAPKATAAALYRPARPCELA